MTGSPVHEKPYDNIGNEHPSRPVKRLADAIMHEEPIVALLGTDEAAILAAVDECINLLLDQPIRIVRMRGSRDSPLTLPRIVAELGAGEQGGLPIDDDELIVRVLTKHSNREGQVVLVIEQAELLPSRTLAFLQIISTIFGARTPRLQIFFVGHPRFEQLIDKDELAGIRDRLETVIRIVGPSVEAALRPSTLDRRSDVRSRLSAVSTPDRQKNVLLLPLALMVVIVGVTLPLGQRNAIDTVDKGQDLAIPSDPTRADPSLTAPPSSQRALPAQPDRLPVRPPAAEPLPAVPPQSPATQPPLQPPGTQPVPAPTLPPQAAASQLPPLPSASRPSTRDPNSATTARPAEPRASPTGEQLVQLREEFDRFLAQTEWSSKRQSESERSRLFNEYLQWNYGASVASPEPPQTADLSPLSRARVTLHFLAGSASGEGLARQFAMTLRSAVAATRTRPVADAPKTFEVRYFAQEDELIAETLAQILQAPDVIWTVRNMPAYRPTPLPHTVELWIPLR